MHHQRVGYLDFHQEGYSNIVCDIWINDSQHYCCSWDKKVDNKIYRFHTTESHPSIEGAVEEFIRAAKQA